MYKAKEAYSRGSTFCRDSAMPLCNICRKYSHRAHKMLLCANTRRPSTTNVMSEKSSDPRSPRRSAERVVLLVLSASAWGAARRNWYKWLK